VLTGHVVYSDQIQDSYARCIPAAAKQQPELYVLMPLIYRCRERAFFIERKADAQTGVAAENHGTKWHQKRHQDAADFYSEGDMPGQSQLSNRSSTFPRSPWLPCKLLSMSCHENAGSAGCRPIAIDSLQTLT